MVPGLAKASEVRLSTTRTATHSDRARCATYSLISVGAIMRLTAPNFLTFLAADLPILAGEGGGERLSELDYGRRLTNRVDKTR
jgi:hypothetical protein